MVITLLVFQWFFPSQLCDICIALLISKYEFSCQLVDDCFLQATQSNDVMSRALSWSYMNLCVCLW